jgi:hypothetical protein
MKLIIAGSRSFNDYLLLRESTDSFIETVNETPIEIVSGHARGADLLGEKYAANRGYPVKLFIADWARHGKAAGYLRNKQMAEYATHCICFWDGRSAGTKMMIDLANEKNVCLKIITW